MSVEGEDMHGRRNALSLARADRVSARGRSLRLTRVRGRIRVEEAFVSKRACKEGSLASGECQPPRARQQDRGRRLRSTACAVRDDER